MIIIQIHKSFDMWKIPPKQLYYYDCPQNPLLQETIRKNEMSPTAAHFLLLVHAQRQATTATFHTAFLPCLKTPITA